MSKQANYLIDMQNTDLNTSSKSQQQDGPWNTANAKLVKSLSHWSTIFNFMRTETSVILAATKGDVLDNLQLIDIVERAIQLKVIGDLISLNILPHKSFIYINFKTAKSAAIFQNDTKLIKGKKIFYVTMEVIDQPISIMIDKIPVEILRKYLPKELHKYGNIKDFKPTLIPIKGREPIETTPVVIDFQLNSTTTKQSFPSYIMIDSIKVYMLVKGKANICFLCDSSDHLASSCNKKYCSSCKKMQPLKHICEDSYALRLKSTLHRIGSMIEDDQKEPFPLLSNYQGDEVIHFSQQSNSDTQSLPDKQESNLRIIPSPIVEELGNLASISKIEQPVEVISDINSLNKKSPKKNQKVLKNKCPSSKPKAKSNKKQKKESAVNLKSYLLRSETNPATEDFSIEGMDYDEGNISSNDSEGSLIQEEGLFLEH